MKIFRQLAIRTYEEFNIRSLTALCIFLRKSIHLFENNYCHIRLLRSAFWVKISRQQVDFYFSQKIGFDFSCKLSPDNLHEMSKPVFCEN